MRYKWTSFAPPGWTNFAPPLTRTNESPVYVEIFRIAKHYFELFQIRSDANTSLLEPGGNHYAFAIKFRGRHILGLDNRAERTRSQVMSEAQWNVVIDHLSAKVTSGGIWSCPAAWCRSCG